MKKKIFKQEKDNFWCSMWVKRQLILLFFSFIAKFTYVSLSMSVLCHPHNVRGLESTRGRRLRTPGIVRMVLFLLKMQLPQVYCHY